MSLLETILGAQNGAVDQIARRFNVPADQARSALEHLLPSLQQGVQRNINQSGGLDQLLSALRNGQHSRYLDQSNALEQEDVEQDGNKILGHILGSKERSREVAGAASAQTGIDPSILKKLLPYAATLLMGSLNKRASDSGALRGGASSSVIDILGGLLGGGGGATQQKSGGGLGGMLGGLLGGLFGKR